MTAEEREAVIKTWGRARANGLLPRGSWAHVRRATTGTSSSPRSHVKNGQHMFWPNKLANLPPDPRLFSLSHKQTAIGFGQESAHSVVTAGAPPGASARGQCKCCSKEHSTPAQLPNAPAP